MDLRDRTLALAGIFQAARLAQQLARDGRAASDPFRASIQSVLMLDAASIEEVFGGVGGVRLGLELIRDKFIGPGEPADLEVAKYAVALLHLAGQLARRPDLQQAIRRGVETAEQQMKFFEAGGDEGVHPSLAEKLAEVYQQTISTLGPRIIVNGDHGYLSNPQIAAKVRAALLAGVRAAWLWRQVGGSRWQLLFARRGIAAEAKRLVAELQPA